MSKRTSDVAMFLGGAVGIALLWFALSVFANAQAMQVETWDGEKLLVTKHNEVRELGKLRAAVWVSPKGRVRFHLHNVGAPAIKRGITKPEPILLRYVILGLKSGTEVWKASDMGAWDGGPLPFVEGIRVWGAIGDKTPRPDHSLVPDAGPGKAYVLDGGAQLWWHALKPGTSPWPMPAATGPPVTLCRTWTGIDGSDAYEGYPLLEATSDSYTGGTTAGTLEWWMRGNAQAWKSRWLVLGVGGPHAFGRIPWAKKCSNGHYDQLALLIGNWLRTGSTATWELACVHAHHRITQGLIASEGHAYAYQHRYEAARTQHTGDFLHPQTSHQWDPGLIMWALLVDDDVVRSLVAKRFEHLCKIDLTFTWPRRYGIRRVGWVLWNLLAFHELWPGAKEHASATAERVMDYAFGQLTADDRFWPNDAVKPTGGDPWQGALMNYVCARWIELGVGTQHKGRVLEFMKHLADNVHGPDGAVPYKITTGSPDEWSRKYAESMTARSVPMLFALKEWEPTYEMHWRRACGFVQRLGAPSEMNFATAKWGTAVTKKFAGFLWTRPVELAR